MENETKTILFFDDWLIQYRQGVERKWFQAEILPGYETPHNDENLFLSFLGPAVLRGKDENWRMWATGFEDLSKGDNGAMYYLYHSKDGVNWEPDKDETGNYRINGRAPFYDEKEQNPARRYKSVDLFPTEDFFTYGGVTYTAFSPDGRSWTIDDEAQWNKQYIDGFSTPVYNPYTGKYFFTGRAVFIDRRIAIYQTEDFKHWEKPLIVLSPDCQDPPMTEFYGMPVIPYAGMFLGFLYNYRCRGENERVIPELTYSTNGIYYQRTNRQPLIRCDSLKYGTIYPASAVLNGDKILIYSFASSSAHNEDYNSPLNSGMFGGAGLCVSSIRKDGFCALENTAYCGEVCLCPMIYRGGDITINASTSAYGSIRAALLEPHGKIGKPIEGFALEDSVPFGGDSCEYALRWKNADLATLKNRPVRLRLELTQARVYAVRMKGIYSFAYSPTWDLNGDYIPGNWEETVKNLD
ncbi:MAG: hypothetical protein FWD23_06050 [Oscillospiraceae bacterium]|nr:hypothetical protein [Oscillospiraceae bacterium]